MKKFTSPLVTYPTPPPPRERKARYGIAIAQATDRHLAEWLGAVQATFPPGVTASRGSVIDAMAKVLADAGWKPGYAILVDPPKTP
jgi:hypothetical protein